MQHDFEVFGTRGALAFSQERFNELHFYATDDPQGRQGFRRIEAGPEHAPYGLFCVAPGHQLGFNDLKAIEAAGFIAALAGRRPEPFNFRAGLRIQTLVETIHASSRKGRWLAVPCTLPRRAGSPRPTERLEQVQVVGIGRGLALFRVLVHAQRM